MCHILVKCVTYLWNVSHSCEMCHILMECVTYLRNVSHTVAPPPPPISGLTKKRRYSEIVLEVIYNLQNPYLGLGNGRRYWGGRLYLWNVSHTCGMCHILEGGELIIRSISHCQLYGSNTQAPDVCLLIVAYYLLHHFGGHPTWGTWDKTQYNLGIYNLGII